MLQYVLQCCSAAIQYHRKNENMQNPHIPAINVQGFHGILKTLSNELLILTSSYTRDKARRKFIELLYI